MARPARPQASAVGDKVGPPASSAPRLHGSQPRPEPALIHRRTTLLSVASLAWGPGALLEGLKGEAGLWKQEAELYGRKAASALGEATGAQQAALQASTQEVAAAAASLQLDTALAEVLLAAPLEALRQSGGAPGSSSGSSGGGGGGSGSFPPVPQLPALDEQQYQRDYAALLQRELPYFKEAGTCGHCGSASADGAAALSDRAWFDTLSYLQYKALARQLGSTVSKGPSTALTGWERMHAGSPEMQLRAAEQAWQDSLAGQAAMFGSSGGGGGFGGTKEEQLRAAAAAYRARGQQLAAARDGSSSLGPPLTAADALRLSVGAVVLRHIEADLAADVAGSREGAREALAAIRAASPELDSVRKGAQALLAWFSSKGFIASATCQQFGLSLDEYENHYVWSLGEPAFLKYWLESPATLRSTAALDQEEGFSQDYVAATLQSYFRRCGVAAGSLKRYPSYSQPDLVAEQWTLRRVAPLPEGHDWQRYQEWRPDACPGSDEEACY